MNEHAQEQILRIKCTLASPICCCVARAAQASCKSNRRHAQITGRSSPCRQIAFRANRTWANRMPVYSTAKAPRIFKSVGHVHFLCSIGGNRLLSNADSPRCEGATVLLRAVAGLSARVFPRLPDENFRKLTTPHTRPDYSTMADSVTAMLFMVAFEYGQTVCASLTSSSA